MSAIDGGILPEHWKEQLAAVVRPDHSGSRQMKRRALTAPTVAITWKRFRKRWRAMKSLSAHHFRSARAALPAAHAYRQGIDDALAVIGLHQRKWPGDATAILVIAADLGLCGGYNSQLAAAAIDHHGRLNARRVYCVGHRPLSLFQHEPA